MTAKERVEKANEDCAALSRQARCTACCKCSHCNETTEACNACIEQAILAAESDAFEAAANVAETYAAYLDSNPVRKVAEQIRALKSEST